MTALPAFWIVTGPLRMPAAVPVFMRKVLPVTRREPEPRSRWGPAPLPPPGLPAFTTMRRGGELMRGCCQMTMIFNNYSFLRENRVSLGRDRMRVGDGEDGGPRMVS